MALLGSQVDHLFLVIDATGSNVTGLTGANFTTDLKRWDGAAIVADADAVSIAEVDAIGDPGRYRASYTPTGAGETGLHVLTVTEGAYSANSLQRVHEFQDIVDDPGSPPFGTAGPYLSTRERFREAFDIKSDAGTDAAPGYDTASKFDDAIDQLLDQVTGLFQRLCDQRFVQTMSTHRFNGRNRYGLVLREQPVLAIVETHVSQQIPRAYGADELLTVAEAYLLDDDGILHRVDGSVWPEGPETVQVKYLSGYDTIPTELERAAQEVIDVKLRKAHGQLYHRKGQATGEGQITYVTETDIPPTAMAVVKNYRRTW